MPAGQRRHARSPRADPRRRGHGHRRLRRRRRRSSSRPQRHEDQIVLVPGGGGRYISMNTTVEAVRRRQRPQGRHRRLRPRRHAAGARRRGRRRHRDPLPPAGHRRASRRPAAWRARASTSSRSPRATWRWPPSTSRRPAIESGKYEGDEEISMVGTSEGVGPERRRGRAGAASRSSASRSSLRLVTQDAMYTKFCNVPNAEVRRLPERRLVQGLLRPADASSTRRSTASSILPESNSNWSELDDPEINAAMDEAEVLVDPGGARRRRGRDDRQDDHRAGAGRPVPVGQAAAARPRRTSTRVLNEFDGDLGLRVHVAQVARRP